MVFSSLNKMRHHATERLTEHLLWITFVIFCLALLLIARITKRVTKPITELTLAAEKIGEGEYENIALPHLKRRTDEVEVHPMNLSK